MRDERIVKDAVFVIDDRLLFSKYGAPSGWDFDDRGFGFPDGKPIRWRRNELISDGKHKYGVYLKRDITPIRSGKAGFAHAFELVSGDGYFVEFFDIDNKSALKIMQKDGFFWCNDIMIPVVAIKRVHYLGVEFDLDNSKAVLTFDGEAVGTYDMTSNTLGRVKIGFDKEYTCHVKLKNIHLWTNFLVQDRCFAENNGKMSYGWESQLTEGARAYRSYYYEGSGMATYCITAAKGAKGAVTRKFDAKDTKVCLNMKYLTKNTDEAVKISLTSGNTKAITVCDDGQNARTVDGALLRNHHAYVWQTLRIEADVKAGNALVKLNGKTCGVVDFENKVTSIDGLEIAYESPVGATLKFTEVSVFEMLPEPEDYVPAPVVPKKKGYYVGLNTCSLWRNGDHWGWDVISPYPENKTYLGYYDEGLPEVMDWEIKWMLEHGVDFELYCWFNNQLDAPLCRTPLSDASLNGHFNAKYGDQMKFALIWEAANCTHPTRETFRKHMVPYFVDYYLTDPRYMVIENKPVIAIFGLNFLIEDFGSPEATKEELDYLRDVVRGLGFDDVIYMASSSGENPKHLVTGIDCGYAYNWTKAGYFPEYTKDRIRTIRQASTLHHVPTVSVGFNNVAWADTRSPLMTTDGLKEMLDWFKDDVLPTNKGEDWKRKFVMLSTWNEYGEGTYMCPAGLNGFGYMDEVRKAFTDGPEEHEDVRPNQNQLDRLGYLYPKGRSRLAVQGWEKKPCPSNVVQRIELGCDKALAEWEVENGLELEVKDGFMYGKGKEFDPQMVFKCNIDAKNVQAIRMDLVTGSLNKPLGDKNQGFVETEFFFTTDKDPEWSVAKGLYSSELDDGTLLFDVSANLEWKDTITAIRIDPRFGAGTFKASFIELLGGLEIYNISINGHGYYPHYYPTVEDGEVYVTFEPQKNIHTLMKLYHEWDLETKTLMLDCCGKICYFTEGSDKAIVDGKQVPLKKPLEFFDGVPMMPMKALCDIAGYKLTIDGMNINIEF